MTVYKRVKSLQNQKLIRVLSGEEKRIVGKLIVDEWKSIPGWTPRDTTISKEPDGNFIVVSYPKVFSPNIDRIILEYVRTHDIGKPKRKRLSTVKVNPHG